jgi:LysR family glycine cleavage system transcriptional activator
MHISGNLSGWSDWFRAAGLPAEQLSLGDQIDASDFCQMATLSGMGVMLGLDFLTEDAVQLGQLVRPFDLSIASAENYYLIKPEQDKVSPAAEQFASWLQESIAS